MSFSSHKSLGETVKEFQATYTTATFITGVAFKIPDSFREDLQFMMQQGVVDNSEYAICENLIYPLLKEVWKHYYKNFLLWSHQFLKDDAILTGFPEYILATRSPLGKDVLQQCEAQLNTLVAA
jgi:hypothetical protein